MPCLLKQRMGCLTRPLCPLRPRRRARPGSLRKGDNIINMSSGKRIKVPRLVRMHADELEDIAEAGESAWGTALINWFILLVG